MRPSEELPIDGPSPLRAIGGGAAALVGMALALGGPPLCMQAALPVGAWSSADAEGAAAAQAGVARWLLISNVLTGAGTLLVLAGVLVLALTPGRRPGPVQAALARATRPWGIAGTALSVVLVVGLVALLSNEARAVAAIGVFDELAARVPYGRQFGPSGGQRSAMLVTILSALAYLVAALMFLPVAHGLRLGAPAAVARARRWAVATMGILVADALATVVAATVSDAPVAAGAVRVALLAPWPVLVWVRSRGSARLVPEEVAET